jgi:hypothetical protein
LTNALPGGQVPSRNPDWTVVKGTDKPWLHTFAVAGPIQLAIRVAPDGSPARPYRVSLHFCELEDAPPAGRFDVIAQSETVLTGIEIQKQAGGANHVLEREFIVPVEDLLKLELAPQDESARPLLCGLEIRAE